jgi:uncharacterized repeat protein (TIGR03803 family)
MRQSSCHEKALSVISQEKNESSSGGIVQAHQSWLAATSFALLAVLAASSGLEAKTRFKTLYAFTYSGQTDGKIPVDPLLRDAAGNLYGVTFRGGANDLGVIFKLNPHGQESVLHSFNGTDGLHPQGGLIADAEGNLYGTTREGGGTNKFGTVFELSKAGALTVLYAFGAGSDGISPEAPLVRDEAGNLYGVAGGGEQNGGLVFRLSPDGRKTNLYNFGGGHHGVKPTGLIMDKNGDLYGTTSNGNPQGMGVIYEIAANGKEKRLYAFTGGFDGGEPQARLIHDALGNLYGTGFVGGLYGNGIVFKFTPAGEESVLHSFDASDGGAAYPMGTLAMDSAGNFYGTAQTYEEIDGSAAVVFKLSPNGKTKILCSFPLNQGGQMPNHLTIDDAGYLYGVIPVGGTNRTGTIFRIKP